LIKIVIFLFFFSFFFLINDVQFGDNQPIPTAILIINRPPPTLGYHGNHNPLNLFPKSGRKKKIEKKKFFFFLVP